MPAKTVSQGSAAPAITAAPPAKAIAAVSFRRPGSAQIMSMGSHLQNAAPGAGWARHCFGRVHPSLWQDQPGPPGLIPGPSTWKNRNPLVGMSGVQLPATWQACTAASLLAVTIIFQAPRFFTPTTTI